jgi:pimeloyl-ACP methyl ester carboxylesterase/class 3 adenylate cyclase
VAAVDATGQTPPDDVEDEVRFAPSDGGRIAYRIFGNGPVDLIVSPGFGSHVDLIARDPFFHRFAARLIRFARVLLFDKRGSGLSDPVEHLPTYEERSRDWGAVMDHAGSERAWLFGHSESGPSAILFAASHPVRVEGLILGSAFASFSLEHRLRLVTEGYLGQAELARAEAMHDDLLARIPTEWGTGRVLTQIVPEYGNALLRPAVALSERLLGDHVRITQQLEAWRAGDVSELLPYVNVPTLVLHRTEDYIPIGHGRFLADQIPGAEFVEAPGSGHNMWSGGEAGFIATQIERFVTGAEPLPVGPTTSLVTVLFTDIVGSTDRANELAEGWTPLLKRHHDLVRRSVESLGGRLVKSLGDGFLASFPGPVAAIRCAAMISAASAELGLPIRAGVHAGEAEMLPDGDLAGVALHFAARVMGVAQEGQILVSRTVRDLSAGSDLEFSSIGVLELKGFDGEHELFASSLGSPVAASRSQMDITPAQRVFLTTTKRFPRVTRAVAGWLEDRTVARQR